MKDWLETALTWVVFLGILVWIGLWIGTGIGCLIYAPVWVCKMVKFMQIQQLTDDGHRLERLGYSAICGFLWTTTALLPPLLSCAFALSPGHESWLALWPFLALQVPTLAIIVGQLCRHGWTNADRLPAVRITEEQWPKIVWRRVLLSVCLSAMHCVIWIPIWQGIERRGYR